MLIRTTLNLPAELLDQARALAEKKSSPVHRVSLSEIVREALVLLLKNSA